MYLLWDTFIVPKYQPRYYSVTEFKYDQIIDEHNDGIIMDFIDKGTDG